MTSSKKVSLSEVNQSIDTPNNNRFWQNLKAFLGPGALVAVGYMDPGNWITSVVGGATYKYSLLFVILISSLIAMQLQQMAGKLGIVTQMDLAQATAYHSPKWLRYTLWVILELALMATDLAEVLGSAIALNLLFGIPIMVAILVTFVQETRQPMIADEKCIDNTLFIDDDGRAYMYFDRFNDGLNIWVVELEDDCTTLKKETMRPCIHVSQEWEKVWPRVNEGCFVIRRNGTYYMTYSANSYESPFYGIGCATADSPLGPWTKYDRNPLLQNPGELVGVGHSALFRDKAGNLKIVFHAHKSKGAIHPREMYITDVRFRPVEGGCRMEIDPGYSPALIAE